MEDEDEPTWGPCPFRQEIDDDESECLCTEQQRQDCAMDI